MPGKLLGNLSTGLVFVVSAPAGTGKTTLVSQLAREFPSVVASISFTTRAPRPDDKEGQTYHFLSREDFEQKIAQGEFLEFVELYGDYYGTSQAWVEEQLAQGKHVILTIDTQGARLLRDRYPAVFIFIAPPSLEELQRRLTVRGTETEAAQNRRLDWATQELEAIPLYDYLLVNDDLDTAYEVLKSILIAEEHKTQENRWNAKNT